MRLISQSATSGRQAASLRSRLDPELLPHERSVSSGHVGLRQGDRLLRPQDEPALGAHLVTPRRAYAHHGVYVGEGKVVHYGALAYNWRGGPVEEISLERFAHGHSVWVRPARCPGLAGPEIVRRARRRLGEDRYRFFTNNCEHFAEWCVNGQSRSLQVEELLGRLGLRIRPSRRMPPCRPPVHSSLGLQADCS